MDKVKTFLCAVQRNFLSFIGNSNSHACLGSILFLHFIHSIIREKIFKHFSGFNRYVTFRSDIKFWKVSFAWWLNVFTSWMAFACVWLWICVDHVYWGKFRIDPVSGESYHRLKVNVFVTLAFLMFCGGIAIMIK